MKKIKDERLQLETLKNIRIAFFAQTLGIIVVLVYYGIKNGFLDVSKKPLWLVFIGTTTLLGYLNMRVTVDKEETKRIENHKKIGPFYKKILLALAIGVGVGLLMAETGGTKWDSFIMGVVFFVCFLIPYALVHYLKYKRQSEEE